MIYWYAQVSIGEQSAAARVGQAKNRRVELTL
jgi:hypothetical protein